MGVYTDRYALYLPGGGSSGTIVPDESVDIDKLNDNFRAIDAALGIPVISRSAVTNPRKWMAIKDGAYDELYLYSSTGVWSELLPQRLTAAGLDGTYLRQDGYSTTLDTRYFTQTALLNGVNGGAPSLDQIYPNKGTVNSMGGQTPLSFRIAGDTDTINATSADSDSGHTGFSGTKNITFPGGRFAAAPTSLTLGVSRSSSFECHISYSNLTATGATIYFWSSNSVSNITFSWLAYTFRPA